MHCVEGSYGHVTAGAYSEGGGSHVAKGEMNVEAGITGPVR
jgi:hypothetical protein